jgi:nucleoside-diphosphate-sugar epimerase
MEGSNIRRVWTEDDWNPSTWEDGLKGNISTAYGVSKTYAEKAAWEFMETENPDFDLIALNPPGVFGCTPNFTLLI